MAKKMLIDATHAEETRVVVVDGNKVEEFDFESENKRQLAGNIYLAKVTRVEPSLQAAFVDYGGNRHGFLAFSEIHPDYYQIPVADREALLEEERAYAEAMKARDEEDEKPKSRLRSRSRSRSKKPKDGAATEVVADTNAEQTADVIETPQDVDVAEAQNISGMETIDLGDVDSEDAEGLSPMELVTETPVEEPTEAGEEAETDAQPVEEDAPQEEPENAAADAPDEAPVTETPKEEVAADVSEASGDESQDDAIAVKEAEDTVPASDGDDTPEGGKTIAANTDSDDPVATKDPETGEETVTEGGEAVSKDVSSEDASAEDGAADAEPVEEAQTEDAPVVEETPAVEAPAEETPVADAPAVEETAEAAKAEDAPAKEAEASEADSADADNDIEDDGTEAPEADDEPRAKGSKASAKDESIESVADEDDSEDIRPPRKPRPRRYKIQEVIKVRQIMLVQVVKEERGNKGAALTTYLSLAGRYCVLMPNTARGGGISRKITNAADRKKLKEIAGEIEVPQGAGLIVRTAGAKRTKTEIKRDYDYLKRMWEQIRELTLKSIAPAKIYEEGDLIKRSIRDLYNREIDEVHVEGERGYRIAKDFMKMIMPSHAKNVKHYTEALPLFARYQVETYLSGMFNPTVQLKSGGYIVIGVTEALVAIDVNSGRATKEGSIEDTALKTNLEAAEEVARQLRLRDLAGLIVIDFIDMDERKNNAAVEKRMKDKLKTDRARIQVGRISGFGLMEMSRQRLRPGMIEATTQPCPACHGTGLIRSDDNLALSILRQIEEEGTRRRSREVLVKCPVAIANYIMNQKREHVAQIEGRYGLSVRIEGEPHLVSPDFTLEKFKTATRVVAEVTTPVVSVDTSIMDEIDELETVEAAPEPTPEAVEEEAKPKKRRRRRRRRGKSSGDQENGSEFGSDSGSETDAETGDAKLADAPAEASEASEQSGEEKSEDKPKRSRRSRSRSRSKKPREGEVGEAETSAETAEAPVAEPAAEPVEAVAAEADAEPVAEPIVEPVVEETVEAEPMAETVAESVTEDLAPDAPVEEIQAEETLVEDAAPEAEPVLETVAEAAPEPEAPAEPPKPKKRGWWSMGR
ncbi:Rne/Rng family ribonuclease [Shimia abyssi]|nr:ribonuclease E/G [Shimia abyssi]